MGFRIPTRLLDDGRWEGLIRKLPALGSPFCELMDCHSQEAHKILQVAQGVCGGVKANVMEETLL